jgi:hypothetical protein
MKGTRIFVGAGLLGLSLSAMAQSRTMATFADPATTATNMFTFTAPQSSAGPLGDTGSLVGSWNANGLTLQTPGLNGGTYANARLVVDNGSGGAISVNNGNTGTGQIRLYNGAVSPSNLLFTISFQNARYNPVSFGAASLLGNGVVFSGPIVPAGLTNASFAFSFSNQVVSGNSLNMTASFTSSAVPEPASLAALGLGAMALIRRRRASK